MKQLLLLLAFIISVQLSYGQYGQEAITLTETKVNEITKGGQDNTREGITIPDITVDFTIPANPSFAYDPQSGEMTIYSTSGTVVGTVDLKNQGKEAFPLTIKDKEGNVYQVDLERGEDGNPLPVAEGESPKLINTYLGKQTEPLPDNSFNPKALSSNTAVVTFDRGNGRYALDKWNSHFKNSVKIRGEYDRLADEYYASWKFLAVGGSDKVTAHIEPAKNNPSPINADSILFMTPQGIRFEAKHLAGYDYELTLAAGKERDVQEIYALYPKQNSKSAFFTLGKLNVATYPKQENTLIVVQVNSSINGQSLESSLNEIYNPVGVKWTVKTEQFNYPEADLKNFIDQNSGVLSAYNDKMNALIAAYKAAQNGGIDSKASYIFVLNDNGVSSKSKFKRDADGFMPRGKQFGFVFTKDVQADALNQIVAHELGHGRWRLQHTFDSTYGGEMKLGSTDNLMDYGSGIHLAKWQWELMNDPAWFVNPFEGDDKGMAAIVTQNALKKLEQYRNDDNTYTFVSLSGKPITIANPAKNEILSEVIFNTYEDKFTDGSYNNVFGAITGFKFTNGKEYRAAKVTGTKSFTGYIQTNSSGDKSSYYIDEITAKKEYQYVLAGFPGIKGNTIVFNVFPLKSTGYKSFGDSFNPDNLSIDEKNTGDGSIRETFFLVPELDSYMAQPRTEGKDYVEVYAQLNLSDIQKEFIGSLGENIIGSEAIYAYAIVDLITEGGVSLPCMFDAKNLKNIEDQKLGEHLFSLYGISGVNSPNPYYSTNPHTVKLQRTYEILNKWAILSKRIHSKDITKESINLILSLLDNFDSEEGRICFIRSLNIDIRKAILEKSGQWSVTTSKEALLANLIATTPAADIQTMVDFLKSDSYKMYWKLYNEINASNTEVYIGAITQLLKNSSSSQKEVTNTTLLVNKDMHVGGLMLGSSILFAEEDEGLITFYPNGGTVLRDGNPIKTIKSQPFTPFDFVRVKFLEDFRFTNTNSTNQDDTRIKKGEEVLVPALWIYGIVDRQTTFRNFTTVRVIADLCAVVASASTAQPEIFIIVDGAFAAADIAAAVAEDKIMSSGSKNMQQLLDTWNTVGMVWGGTVLTRTAGYMVINRVALINYFKSSVKGNISKTQEFFSEFSKLYNEIKATNSSSSFLSHLDNIRLTIQIQSKILYIQKVSVLADEAQYSLQQGEKLVVSLGRRDHYLGKVIVDDSKNISGIEDIQWYNKTKHGDVSESLSIIDDIEYLPQSSTTKTKGDLEVVTAKNGSVYLRIAEEVNDLEIIRGISKAQFMSSMEKITLDKKIVEKAFDLWKNENWKEFEKLFLTNNLNDKWPPLYGFKGITKVEKGNDLAGKIFDRFQGKGDINGEFASPILGNEGIDDLYFTYDSRALKYDIADGTNYVKFKFNDNIPNDVVFTYGDIIPWFNRSGLGDQVMSSKGLRELYDKGYIEIIERFERQQGKWIKIK